VTASDSHTAEAALQMLGIARRLKRLLRERNWLEKKQSKIFLRTASTLNAAPEAHGV
jgi:hypothetical protein